MEYGVTSMTAPLRRAAVRRPAPTSDFARAHWAQPLDVDLLLDQHAAFVGILQRLGVDVIELPALDGLPDSCFTYDPAFTVSDGVVTLRAAKQVRVGEGERLAADLAAAGVPTVASLGGSATADGGDMFWLDDATLAIGRSYRTNSAAVAQLDEILRPRGIRIEVYDVPHDQGPEWCLHLMSVVSPVRDDLAVVYERLAPVAMLEELRRRGVELLPIPEEDWLTLGCNVLAVAPGVVVIASGNEATAEALASRGCEVHVYAASEISKGEGGPTCLTRPIWRA
ncbi:MAG: dimethylarginine dimethylaminohydrolase family protein [Candidatus Nanopelagicales bacterium]|jgi:N-dimethylarginine dimethylaminohydrolase